MALQKRPKEKSNPGSRDKTPERRDMQTSPAPEHASTLNNSTNSSQSPKGITIQGFDLAIKDSHENSTSDRKSNPFNKSLEGNPQLVYTLKDPKRKELNLIVYPQKDLNKTHNTNKQRSVSPVNTLEASGLHRMSPNTVRSEESSLATGPNTARTTLIGSQENAKSILNQSLVESGHKEQIEIAQDRVNDLKDKGESKDVEAFAAHE